MIKMNEQWYFCLSVAKNHNDSFSLHMLLVFCLFVLANSISEQFLIYGKIVNIVQTSHTPHTQSPIISTLHPLLC